MLGATTRIRTRHVSLAILTLLLSGCAVQHPSMERQIRCVLDEQARAWNAGDIDRFMKYYWRSEQLTFSSGGQTRRGWEATRQRYHERYPTPERMGHVEFADIEVRPLCVDAALVVGRWRLVRQPDPVGGNFTLVMQHIGGGWVITHDHTSVDEKAP